MTLGNSVWREVWNNPHMGLGLNVDIHQWSYIQLQTKVPVQNEINRVRTSLKIQLNVDVYAQRR